MSNGPTTLPEAAVGAGQAFNRILIELQIRIPPFKPKVENNPTVTSGEVTLKWKDNSNNEDGFKIERKDASPSSDFKLLTQVAPNVEIFTDRGLAKGKYKYQIRAFNLRGDSNPDETNEVEVK